MLLQIHKDQAWQATPLEAEVAILMERAFQEYAAIVAEAPDDAGAHARAERVLMDRWRDAVGRVLLGAGHDAAAAVRMPVGLFTLTAPEVQLWLAAHGADMVTQVSDTTRETIKGITIRGNIEGLSTKERTRMLREVVPLLPQHAASIEKRLAAALAGGASERDAVTTAGREARRLLRWRAKTIAITETSAGHNGGMQLAWSTAKDAGYLLPETRKVWLYLPEGDIVCATCKPWDGLEAAVDEVFSKGGRDILHPPIHPRCHCKMGLVTRFDRAHPWHRVTVVTVQRSALTSFTGSEKNPARTPI